MSGRFGKNITPKTCYCSGDERLHWLLVLKENRHEEEMYGFHIHNATSRRVIYERLLVTSDMYNECEVLGKVSITCDGLESICTRNLEKGWYGANECCYKWTESVIKYLLDCNENNVKENTLYRVRIASPSCLSATDQFMLHECQIK